MPRITSFFLNGVLALVSLTATAAESDTDANEKISLADQARLNRCHQDRATVEAFLSCVFGSNRDCAGSAKVAFPPSGAKGAIQLPYPPNYEKNPVQKVKVPAAGYHDMAKGSAGYLTLSW